MSADLFLKSVMTTKGDNVAITTDYKALYIILPFGSIAMRIIEFGGSLDKPYLLLFEIFPLLIIYTIQNLADTANFKWIFIYVFCMLLGNITSVLLASYGYLKKIENKIIIDPLLVLPIIFRLLLVGLFAIKKLRGSAEIIIHIVIFFIILLTNGIHMVISNRCNSDNSGDGGNRFLKVLVDSIAQFGAALILPIMLLRSNSMEAYNDVFHKKGIPVIGSIYNLLNGLLWIVGYFIAYIFTNMVDANYENVDRKENNIFYPDQYCSGHISPMRAIIAVIIFLVTGSLYVFNTYRWSMYASQGNEPEPEPEPEPESIPTAQPTAQLTQRISDISVLRSVFGSNKTQSTSSQASSQLGQVSTGLVTSNE